MKKNKFILASVAALMAVSPVLLFGSQAHTVQAATNHNLKPLYEGTTANHIDITLNHNSYVYNNKGVRIKGLKLSKGSSLKVKGNIEKINQNQNPKYYLISYNTQDWNQKYWLPYKVINGKAYYSIGNGKYIRVANVKTVYGDELLANSGYVTVKKNTFIFDANANETKIKAKKGQKFKVDLLINLTPNMPSTLGYYRIAGSKNKYLYAYYVKEPRIPLRILPKNYKNTYVYLTRDTTWIRNSDGTKRTQINMNHSPSTWHVDELRYIWIPEDNKAELFYHISNNDSWKGTQGGYVNANDVRYAGGPQLQPVNAASSVVK